jgi:LacI family transcriptional regulator
MGTKRATIVDVAKVAGVSWKTVSRVVNREPNVSEKVTERVRAAINQLGYVPDTAARSLAGTRAYTIGILFDNPSPNYTMKIQAGAYAACRANGYHLLIENLESDRGPVADQMQPMLRNARVDGFILTPPITDNAAVMDMLEANDIPYVRIAPVSFPGRSMSLSINDLAAATEIARHFWELGHHRFGIVGGPAEHGAAGTRRAGFLAELAALGNTNPVSESNGGFSFEGGIQAGRELLSLPEPPTAIFAMNDDSAAGVISAAAQMGLNVPRDVAVAGFDDSWIAQSVWPNLTTVYQPIAEMAQAAAEILIARNGSDGENASVELSYKIVLRDSTLNPERHR